MDIKNILEQNENKDLLRFTTAGSVDDGKSTLIGRLLYDSKTVFEDHLKSLEKDSVKHGTTGKEVDYALLLDGLKAEREQGITIDVAYRYFSTPKRKFIIADTPGHEQYTRNMATGASTANLAIILADASKGILPQTRRHSFIASLLGIKHIIIAVNKMDLVDYDKEVFEKIKNDFTAFSAKLNVQDIHFIPISALKGDNVVERSMKMPWYKGTPILNYLEEVHIASDENLIDLRFPIQFVSRPNREFRGYSGSVASGIIRVGDRVMALPSEKISEVKRIISPSGNVREAFAPMSVTVCLKDEIDVSRGDMLVHIKNQPEMANEIDSILVWMDDNKLEIDKKYILKHSCNTIQCLIDSINYKFNINTLSKDKKTNELNLNEIGRVRLSTPKPLFYDSYLKNRKSGSFILIDPISNLTVAAGMIIHSVDKKSKEEKSIKDKQKPSVIWAIGKDYSSSLKTSEDIKDKLSKQSVNSVILSFADIDNIISSLSVENNEIRKISTIKLIVDLLHKSGLTVILPEDENFLKLNNKDILNNFNNVENYGVILDDINIENRLDFFKSKYNLVYNDLSSVNLYI
ncbi:MAG TPA: sulfate adenylyltransferase subunit CysN [Victivallales bacterium]|nr:sulfate adenylyltransferase subunit CysN [Victivallales bacterium]